jgi:phenylacetate-CoA ligase
LIIAETAAEMGVDLRRSKLRLGFHGAEPWSNQMRQEIESKLGISATDVYGLTEVLGPGVAAECTEKDGLHLAEDHFLAEIVDPDTGEPLPYGKQGELVLTTLTKEGMPLLRFRTRDITWLNREPCRCGRTLARMAKVRGRTDDMLIIRGVNVFPSQIESVLLAVEGVEPHYLIVVDRQRHLDDLEVWVEVPAKLFTDELAALETLEQKIRAELESVLGLSSRVRLVEPGTIERSEGKAKRVIDRRQM